ncbi:hypothetical protein ANN_00061 [Periplaneta americana]|uniref:Uncharacterized protein n=1 Tax=Periplaneta americana TaxID=6978 RepID=A0ABQ8TRD1_PERAM|nr:hypothetical protein ANN_00061 [Periplaneta americana]
MPRVLCRADVQIVLRRQQNDVNQTARKFITCFYVDEERIIKFHEYSFLGFIIRIVIANKIAHGYQRVTIVVSVIFLILSSLVPNYAKSTEFIRPYDDEKLTQCVVEFSKAAIPGRESIYFHLSDDVPYLDYYVSDPFSTESISLTLNENLYCSLEEKQVTATILLPVARHVSHWVDGNDVKEDRRKLRMMNMLVFFENSLLHSLHASERWKIAVSPMNTENDASKDYVYNTYLLVVSFMNNDLLKLRSDITNRLVSLYKTENLSQVARYITVISGDPATEEVLQMISSELNNYDLNNVIVTFKDAEPGVVIFYSWHPHEPPS